MTGPGPLHSFAFQEAMRALGQQQATLESVRGRAGVLLSAATISTSFFGAQALGHRLSGALPIVASVMFVAVGVCVTAVLWPRRGLLFDSSLLQVLTVQNAVDAPRRSDAESAITDFVDEVRQHVSTNNRRLDQLFLLLSTGWVLFLIEILIWLAHALTV